MAIKSKAHPLPTGTDGEYIYLYAKRFGVESMLDDMFVLIGSRIYTNYKRQNVSNETLITMGRSFLSDGKLLWGNQRHLGLIVWYQSIVNAYSCEACSCIVNNRIVADGRKDFIRLRFTLMLEEYMHNTASRFYNYANYQRWLQTIGDCNG